MKDDCRRSEREHREVAELLPWYANATLKSDEAERVEAHLAGCEACRRELAGERRLTAAMRRQGAEAPSPHPVQLARLMARIDAAEASARPWRAAAAGLGRLGRPWREASAGLRWALAAQLAAIVVLAGLALRPEAPREAPPAAAPAAAFRTLSDPGPATAGGVRLRVVFSEEASEREIRQLLLGVRAEITAGPSPFGAYTLTLPRPERGGDELAQVVAHLRGEPAVRLVEVVAPGEE